MSKTITVYTTNSCASCAMVKRWLKSKNLDYQEVNVEDKPEKQEEMLRLSGRMIVPVTVVSEPETDSMNITVGWNPSKLAGAVASMQPMVEAA